MPDVGLTAEDKTHRSPSVTLPMQIEIKKIEDRIEAGRGPFYDILYCDGRLKITHWVYETTKYREFKMTLEITLNYGKDFIPESVVAAIAPSDELRIGYKPFKVVYREEETLHLWEDEFMIFLKENPSFDFMYNMAMNIIADMIDPAQQGDAPYPGSKADSASLRLRPGSGDR